jgi:hypothetical protein
MKKLFFIFFLVFNFLSGMLGQNSLKTIAESSNFESTSRYDDVMNFIKQLEKSSKYIRTETIAITEEGREIPLIVIGNPLPKSPKDLINDPRIVIYIQGNIHAGEVEGKEALQMFTRDLLSKKDIPLLKDVVLLICPIFNVDGNEKISVKNRTNQVGPKNGVGVRNNGAFLDLNRDALKLESPEVKGLVANVLNKWDPAVFMDCHTTNGVFRQEPTTFTWMMNPNGDRNLINYMRDKMMPEVHKNLLEKYKIENCFYGEFNDMGNLDSGYVSYAHEPRYIVNYVGLRNRLSILNENYVYADFKSRVLGSYALIQTVTEYVQEKKTEIKKMLKDADQKVINRWINNAPKDSFTFDYSVRPIPYRITVKTFEVVKDTDQQNYIGYLPTDVKKTLSIPYLADYYANKSAAFPYAYLITMPDKAVLKNLNAHGIKLEKLSADQTFEVESFKIKDLKGSQRLNQGHYTNSIEGSFVKETRAFQKGTWLVKTTQPLANVIVYLLEPQSGDGFLFWNFFDKYLEPQWGMGFYDYPVYRLDNKVAISSELVN